MHDTQESRGKCRKHNLSTCCHLQDKIANYKIGNALEKMLAFCCMTVQPSLGL